jgi:DNA-binding beta-propeller fold protein YncE
MRAHWLLLLALASSPHPLGAQSLKKVAAIDLPGPKGQRFDYLTVDEEHQYLLSAHLGPGILYVIDMRTNRLIKAIPGVPGITGLEYVPGLQKIYTSNWGENKIGVVDLRSMTVVKRLPTADKPNGSVYAAHFKKVYVSDTDGRAMAIVDVEKDTIVKTLRFNSETGMPQYDSAARKVYVNLRRTNEIAEIDDSFSANDKPVRSWANVVKRITCDESENLIAAGIQHRHIRGIHDFRRNDTIPVHAAQGSKRDDVVLADVSQRAEKGVAVSGNTYVSGLAGQ